jgi:phosphomannomutase
VEDLFAITGRREYDRLDLRLDAAVKDAFVAGVPTVAVSNVAGRPVEETVREDGLKILLDDDAWLLMRPSGTEPLVRVYAEAATTEEVADLIEAGRRLVLASGD